MSELSVFFASLDKNKISEGIAYTDQMLGHVIQGNYNDFPDLDGIDLAIIGVNEGRRSIGNSGCVHAPDEVRKYLYRLFQGSFSAKIVDLGNIVAGDTVEDTYYALSNSVDHLIRKNIIPIIIGGGHDLTYAQFLGYEKLEQTINVVTVDSNFNLGTPEDDFTSKTFLGNIILHQPNYLFNYSNIGYQTYLVSQSQLQMMSKLYFDVYRLGQVRDNILESEPIIRHADFLSFDVSAIKHADAPAHPEASPNGFYAEEACQMMWYAGMNDRMSSIGIYELNPEHDIQGKTTHLAAQMIWCFMDGFYGRKRDYPSRSSNDYTRFHVFLQDNKYEINFYKSKKSDRWWMEVPYPSQKGLKFERHTLVPCSYKDYETACKDEIPDRWWQTYQKLS
jgi:arginase family enzyme